MSALEMSQKLLAFSVLLQTIEMIGLRRYWADTGIWSWATLAQDYDQTPLLKKILASLLNERAFWMVLGVRFLASAAVLSTAANVWMLGALFATTWLTSIRWRGTLNGGSDSMTLVVALAVWIGELGREQPIITAVALGYVAVQLTASYFVAGLVKIRSPSWRNGTALAEFFKTPGYDSPPEWIRRLAQPSGNVAKITGYLIILFECAFPMAWLSPSWCMCFIGAAFVFHVLNFFVFGLNRFVFAWLAAYPALIFWSERLAERATRH